MGRNPHRRVAFVDIPPPAPRRLIHARKIIGNVRTVRRGRRFALRSGLGCGVLAADSFNVRTLEKHMRYRDAIFNRIALPPITLAPIPPLLIVLRQGSYAREACLHQIARTVSVDRHHPEPHLLFFDRIGKTVAFLILVPFQLLGFAKLIQQPIKPNPPLICSDQQRIGIGTQHFRCALQPDISRFDHQRPLLRFALATGAAPAGQGNPVFLPSE
ncbi:hypothetical protein ebA1356 [Aromatoleum aromaticum EbN1]|uniref:Uncharacterized protein n=1 Tax=Aromatoleum aromaticum (strain DSM 19018 / LMG 30748 / EbN1) TaxID=76114 RepID=Q5P751_AROAE|nr:hypothetical protein ebA1356 [Aromatoleum aromaticum EbN1]